MKGESNEKLVKISLNVRDGPDGIPVVDVDSELFEDINDEIFVSFPNESIFNSDEVHHNYVILLMTFP